MLKTKSESQEMSDGSGNITMIDKNVLINFCKTWGKKHLLLILIITIDIILSVLVSFFYILNDKTLSTDLRSCLNNQTTNGITLLSQKCHGNEIDRNTISLAFIYYLTFLTSIIGLILIDTKATTLQVIQYSEVKLVYCVRAVSLFIYMDYTSERIDDNILFYTSWISSTSQLIMLGSSVAISMLVVLILYTLDSYEGHGINHVLSSFWLILIITMNLTWYIPTANIHSRNVFSFIDIRGPGLQFITYVNFSIVVLSLLEFVIINHIRGDTEERIEELANYSEENKYIQMPLLRK